MNKNTARGGLVIAAIMGGLFTRSAAAPPPKAATEPAPASLHTLETIRHWPKTARIIVRAMLEQYGKPDQVSPRSVAWYNNRPWQTTEVFRDPGTHRRLEWDKDYLRQSVKYYVPEDKIADLKRFDERLRVDTIRGELSSRSDAESMNYLALNLADDIITEKRSVEDARAFYVKTQRLAQSGKMSPYLDRFLFEIQTTNNFY